ncbi:MAG: propionate CoA-transferase [Candidatus Hydrogenedentota bacterium]
MPAVVTADEAIRRVPDNATVAVNPVPTEEVFPAFRRAFESTGRPNNLTILFTAGLGPFSADVKGMNHFAVPGMVSRIIAGHIGVNHLLVKMVAEDAVECYNFPQGTLAQLYREIAAKRPGLVTTVGLETFVDPRIDGGKTNRRTKAANDLVQLVQLNGEEYLFYKSIPLNVGIVRGTTADPQGNITCENEPLLMDAFELALAVKNCGGTVIVQVEQLSASAANPHMVRIPGMLVDYIVVAPSRKVHPHSLFVEFDPSFTGETTVPLSSVVQPMSLTIEKVICSRAARELAAGMTVNLGVGIPQGVSAVAFEEGILEDITLNTEFGVIGGQPDTGKNFGPARNPRAFVSQPAMFDFYDGGGLDVTCVGLAQVDREGNVNVSRLGNKVIGCGGFIDLTQNAKQCIFCGEFRAGGLKASVGDGKLTIESEGKAAKFVQKVDQITYSGNRARRLKQDAMFVTERCVFHLVPEGLLLSEIAPGIDLQRDILDQMEFRPIVPDDIPLMDVALFRDRTLLSSGWTH